MKRKSKDKAVKTPKSPPTVSAREAVEAAKNLAELKTVLIGILNLD